MFSGTAVLDATRELTRLVALSTTRVAVSTQRGMSTESVCVQIYTSSFEVRQHVTMLIYFTRVVVVVVFHPHPPQCKQDANSNERPLQDYEWGPSRYASADAYPGM